MSITRRLFLQSVPPAVAVGTAVVVPAFAETQTEIERLFAEWLAVRNRPWETETDEESEAGYAEYRRLQIAIVESGLKPTSPRDLALQYIVDTDFCGSESSEHFETVVRDVLGETISEGGVL